MSNIKCVYLHACFHCICWMAVISMVSYWIYKYTLNEDLCIVEYKNYYESNYDEPPVLSICLRDPISEDKLRRQAPHVDRETYLGFLDGSNFNVTLVNIDYEAVRLNISEFTDEYWSSWENGSHGYTGYTLGSFMPSVTYIYFERFYQCYTLQQPKQKGLKSFGVRVNSSLFPDRTRPIDYDMASFLHYPNHFFKSNFNFNYLLSRESNDQYVMRYRLDGVEVIKRRNKKSRPCKDWINFDKSLIEDHVKKVGCRTSNQPLVEGVPVCLTEEATKNAAWNGIKTDYEIDPSCKLMENIYYTYSEGDLAHTANARKNKVDIYVYPYQQGFKEILQTR